MALPDLGAPVLDALMWSGEAALTRRYEAIGQRDRAKLIKILNQAYDGADLKTIAIAGMVLARSDGLRPKDANNIAPVLVKFGRFADVLTVLEHPNVRDLEDQGRLYFVARALGGLGRLDEAIEVADRALALKADCAKTLPLREILTTAITLRDRTDLTIDPAEAVRLANLFEARGLPPAARSVLERIITPDAIASDAAGSGWLDAAEAALSLIDTAAVQGFLLANEGRLGDEERRQALLMVCDAMLGQPAPEAPRGSGRATIMARAFVMETAHDLDAAIPLLARRCEQDTEDRESLRTLARCVGRKVLDIVQPRFTGSGQRRIVNLLPFYNEFTMLQMRLHEMADWVDEFVIVEATKTFTGLDKPLNFEARKAEFAAFGDKITHVVVDDYPACIDSAWSRDCFQRDMAVRGISGRYGPNDLVLLTDADEIIRRRAIEGFEGDFAGLEMPMFRYFLNYRPAKGSRKRILVKSSIWKAAYLEGFGSSHLRFDLAREKLLRHVIRDAGWHFTSVMDSAAVSRKMHSTAHIEHTFKRAHDEAHYEDLLTQIRQGNAEAGWERCDVDETYPAFVRERTRELAHMLL